MTKTAAIKLVEQHHGFKAEFSGDVLNINGSGTGNLMDTITKIIVHYPVLLNNKFNFSKLP